MKKTILLIFPRGEAIKNFIESGVSDILRQKYKIALISVVPDEEFRELLVSKSDIFYELDNSKDSKTLRWLRDQIDIAHGRWLWSGAAKNRWHLRDSEAKTINAKIQRGIRKIIGRLTANYFMISILSRFEHYLSSSVYVNKKYKKLIAEIAPDLVFNTSHIHNRNSLKVINAAKSLNLKTLTFLFSWDNLTSQGRITPYYDHYFTWNKAIAGDLKKIYPFVKNSQITVTGTPQFDFHFDKSIYWTREEFAAYTGADSSRPIILYTTGMLNLYPYEEIIVERIADMLLEMKEKPQLMVRVYPKETSGRFKELAERRSDILFPPIKWVLNHFTPTHEDIVFYTNSLYHCDAGINASSTVAVELSMFNKPVIGVGYNPPGKDISPRDYAIIYQWEHYKPVTESNSLYVCYSEDDMKNAIVDALANPLAKKKEQDAFVNNFFDGMPDGKAHIRIADAIDKIISEMKN